MLRVVRYEVKYNKHNKRWIVFEVPDKKGLWKIKKSFEKEKDAKDWVKEETKKKTKKKKRKKK